ncbi:enoyl-CoA hydratase-related protein [Mesorhizobium atlanticum]
MVSGVDGIAVGIGTTLNLHCDLTFATPRTLFRTPFVDLGLVPEAGSSLIAPQLLGRQGAFALLGLGEGFSAERAKAAGLIYDVVAEEALESTVLAAADGIAGKPPQALKIARDLMREPREALIARATGRSRAFSRAVDLEERACRAHRFHDAQEGELIPRHCQVVSAASETRVTRDFRSVQSRHAALSHEAEGAGPSRLERTWPAILSPTRNLPR